MSLMMRWTFSCLKRKCTLVWVWVGDEWRGIIEKVAEQCCPSSVFSCIFHVPLYSFIKMCLVINFFLLFQSFCLFLFSRWKFYSFLACFFFLTTIISVNVELTGSLFFFNVITWKERVSERRTVVRRVRLKKKK